MPTPPSPSGYAAIDDISKLPLITAQGLAGYQRFLRSAFPRAFAISPGGAHWAWKGSSMDDVSQLALSRCAESAHTTCQLYANDDEVVWVVGH